MTTFNINNSKIGQLNNKGNNYKVVSDDDAVTRMGAMKNDKVAILFLAANPHAAPPAKPLRLDEEIRDIQSEIQAAEFRHRFDLVSRWAVRPDDLLKAFNEVRPHIVHFSGHGTKGDQLILEDQHGKPKPVEKEALVALFRTVKDNIRVVILNACHSDQQAKAISDEIDCTIGMNTAIGDKAAIKFAASFYGALAFGKSVGEAFEQGRLALMLNGIPEENTPVLLARPGVDAKSVFLIDRKPVSPVLSPLAYEILVGAVSENTPIQRVYYDGGVGVMAGGKTFDCNFNLEQAALLEDAVSTLERVNWIQEREDGLFYVTRAGYEAGKQVVGSNSAFLEVRQQMPGLIQEMKTDLEKDGSQLVREFFIRRREYTYGRSSGKLRFIYYEEDHANLRGMVDILENHGYVADISTSDTPLYRMSEDFVKLIMGS